MAFFKGAKPSALHALRNFATTQQGSRARRAGSSILASGLSKRALVAAPCPLVFRRLGCYGVIGRNGCDPFSNGAKRFYSVDRYPVQHFKPRGSNWWFRQPRIVRIVVSVGHAVFLVGMVYFKGLEDVPYTKRRHFILLSRDTERKLGEKQFEEMKAHYEGKIVPPMHPESVRARLIAEDIIEALRRGLRNEQDTFEGTERVARDTVMAPSGKKSEKLEETWSREEDLDDRRVDQSRKKGRERRSQPTTSHQDGFNWEVLVVNEPVVNAQAFLDGKIVVFTGLMEHFIKDAEIATVIAHENQMAHVVARHAAEKAAKDIWFTFLEQILGMFAEPDRVDAMSSHHLWHPSNRKLEIEADHIGLLLMASAGYDPRVAPKVYEELDKVNGYAELPAAAAGEGYRNLSLHPCGEERAQLLAQAPALKEALALYRNSTPSNGPAHK